MNIWLNECTWGWMLRQILVTFLEPACSLWFRRGWKRETRAYLEGEEWKERKGRKERGVIYAAIPALDAARPIRTCRCLGRSQLSPCLVAAAPGGWLSGIQRVVPALVKEPGRSGVEAVWTCTAAKNQCYNYKHSIITFSGQASMDVNHWVLGSQGNLYPVRVHPWITRKLPFKVVPQGLVCSQLMASSSNLLT